MERGHGTVSSRNFRFAHVKLYDSNKRFNSDESKEAKSDSSYYCRVVSLQSQSDSMLSME